MVLTAVMSGAEDMIKVLIVSLMSGFVLSRNCTKYKCEQEHGNVRVGHFSGYVINNRYLNGTNQTQINATKEKDCVKKCVRTDPCRTISVVPIENEKRVTCYLSTSNIYREKVIVKKGSRIISLGTPVCESSPCKNGGRCKPDYENGKFTCKCLPKWDDGENCERRANPNVAISFDNHDALPTTNNVSYEFKPVNVEGKVLSVPHAKSPVFMTKTEEKLYYSFKNMAFLDSQSTEPRRLTIGLWVRIRGDLKYSNIDIFRIGDESSMSLKGNYLKASIPIGSSSRIFINTINLKHLSTDTWHHLGFSVGPTVFRLFVDGDIIVSKWIKDIAPSSDSSKIFALARPKSEAYNPELTFFLDEIKIYNVSKKPEFIREWYDSEKENYL